jgi:Flp pilus assembly protein TadD
MAMKRIASKLVTTSLIAALAMTGAVPSVAMRRGLEVHRASGEAARQAADFSTQAGQALRAGQLDSARAAMEQAVALSPRDAGYRLTLADIYLKSGRFESARATYADVLELDPDRVRAALGYALTQIALGHPRAAVTQLDNFADRGPAADIGLAYALAGEPARAIAILEPAARGYGATPRQRQNQALAYALAGNWRRAPAVASQDVSPADLAARMEQWAAFARPGAGQTRIAGLLGVSPVHDSGQPVRLALNAAPDTRMASVVVAPAAAPAAAPVAVASAQPAAAPPSTPAESDWGLPASAAPATAPPVRVAEAAPPLAPTPVPASTPPADVPTYYAPAPTAPPVRAADARFADAARVLDDPRPRFVRAARVTLPTAPIFRRANPAAARGGNSPYVVQIGAFSNETNAEAGWLTLASRYGLAGRAPLTTTIDLGGRVMHRVAVAGFASQSDARQLCGAIKAQGGVCFVRERAGDASIRWAARYAPDARRQRDV